MPALGALRTRFWQRCSPEERVLLACCRQRLDDGDRARLREAIAAGPRWEVVLAASVKHQVAPLVLESLIQAGLLDALPEAVRAGFQHAFGRNLAAKQALAEKLGQVLDEVRAWGFEVLLLKGTSLDQRVWAKPWLTASADLDLLLRAGWRDLTETHKARIREWNAGRPQADVHAERHPDLVMNGVLPVDFAGIQARALPVEVMGRPAYLMAAEDELLAVCINACRKRYFRLKSLAETAEMLSRFPGLDWDAVAARARAWRVRGIVYTALVAAQASVGCTLPEGLRARLDVSRARAALLQALIARMGFGALPDIHRSRVVAGKHLSRWLVLQYASLGPRELVRSLAVVARQGATRIARPGAALAWAGLGVAAGAHG